MDSLIAEAYTPEVLRELKTAHLACAELSACSGLFDDLFTDFAQTLGHSCGLRLFGFDAWEDSWSCEAAEPDQEDMVYTPDFSTLLDPRACSWLAEVLRFSYYLEEEFAAQTGTRRFRALVGKQERQSSQVLDEVGFSRQVEEYVRRVCIWGSLIRAAARTPHRYAGILLERLRQYADAVGMNMPELVTLDKIMRSQAGSFEGEHERLRAAIAGLGFRAAAAYFDEIDCQCDSLVGRLVARRLRDLNEGTVLTLALFRRIQGDAIENAYSQLIGLTYMQRFVYDVNRYKSADDDFLKEAALGLSSTIEGLVYKLFLVEQHPDLSFGNLIRQLRPLLTRTQSQFLRVIKKVGDRCRHHSDYTVSRGDLDKLCNSALDLIWGLRRLAFRTECPECRMDVVRLDEILDSLVGADTVRRSCGHAVWAPQVTIKGTA